MKNSIYMSSLVAIVLLASATATMASAPADKVTVCPSNSNVTLFEWKELDGKQHVKEYRQWNQPYSPEISSLKGSNVITFKEYSSLCGKVVLDKNQPAIQQQPSPKQGNIK